MGSVWQVVRDRGDKVVGTHKSKKEATEHLYALHMNVKEKK
jgi:hypothetical protein